MLLQRAINIKIMGEVFYTLLHANSWESGVNLTRKHLAVQTGCTWGASWARVAVGCCAGQCGSGNKD